MTKSRIWSMRSGKWTVLLQAQSKMGKGYIINVLLASFFSRICFFFDVALICSFQFAQSLLLGRIIPFHANSVPLIAPATGRYCVLYKTTVRRSDGVIMFADIGRQNFKLSDGHREVSILVESK